VRWQTAPDLPGRLGNRPGGRLWLSTIFTVISAARRADVLFFPWSALPRILVAPAVVTVHDVCFRTHPERFVDGGRLGDAQLEAAVRSAAEVLTPSAASKCGVVAAYGVPERHVTVVRHGVAPIFDSRPMLRDADACSRRKLRPGFLLGVSTHEPRKNLEVLVRAFVAMTERTSASEKQPDLVLIGRRSAYTSGLATGLSRSPRALLHTTFIDSVSDAELAALYRQAGAVVLPSVCEGFGFPALESIACGTPVIVSDLAVFRELLGEAALYVAPNDVDAWAGAMTRAVRDPTLRSRAIDASIRLKQQFAWRTSAIETLDVLQRAARSGHRLHFSKN
jgi:glycosyltransferase involved in cell wall biosynthesis